MQRGFNTVLTITASIMRFVFLLSFYTVAEINDIGLYSITTSFISFGTFLIGLEIHRLLNREFTRSNEQNLYILERCMIALGLSVILALLYGNLSDYKFLILMCMILLFEWLNLEISRIFLIKGYYLLSNFLNTIRTLMPICILVMLNGKMEYWFHIWLILLIILLIIGFYCYRLYLPKLGFNWARLKFKFSFLPVLLTGVLNPFLLYAERAVFLNLFGLGLLGQFALVLTAFGIVEVIYQSLILQPMMQKLLKNNDENGLKSFIKYIFIYFGLSGLVTIVSFYLFGDVIMRALNKEQISFGFFSFIFIHLILRQIIGCFTFCLYASSRDVAALVLQSIPIMGLCGIYAASFMVEITAKDFFMACVFVNLILFGLSQRISFTKALIRIERVRQE